MLSNKELHEQKTTLTSKTDELDPVSYVLEPTIHFNYRGQDVLQNYQQSKWENHNPKNVQENKIHVSTLCYEPETPLYLANTPVFEFLHRLNIQ